MAAVVAVIKVIGVIVEIWKGVEAVISLFNNEQEEPPSPTYGDDCKVTQLNPDAVIPLIYGTHRVAGNVIWQGFNSANTVQYLYVALCRGPIESVSDIEVNDEPFNTEKFPNSSCTIYYGTPDQTVDSRCPGGAATVGGLKNLAYLAFSLKVGDNVDGGIPNVTCKVKGRKVSAYSGSTTPVRNLLTANQADVETNTTGFLATSGASISRAEVPESGAIHGSYALKTITTGGVADQGFYSTSTTVTGSKTYSVVVWLLNAPGTVKLYLEERTAADVWIGETASDPINLSIYDRWSRHTVTRDFGPNGKKARIKIVTDSPQDITWYTDQLMLYEGEGVNVWMPGGSNIGWSNNPAWCLLDLLLNTRDGVGYSLDQIDLDSFKTVAQYCDTVISNDPYRTRFKLNVVIDWKEAWINVLQRLHFNFHAYMIFCNGRLSLKQMVPSSSVQSFTYPGTIVPDSLALSWQGLDQDYDLVRCYYTDPKTDWKRQYAEYHSPANPLASRKLEIELYGTTDLDQAARIAAFHYRLHDRCKVTGQFSTSIRGADRTPGDIVDITDPRFGWDHKPVMITSIKELENHDIQFTFQVYDPTIFSDSKGMGESGATAYRLPNRYSIPPDPSNLVIMEIPSSNVVGVYRTAIDITFTPPSFQFYKEALIQISDDEGASYRDVGTTTVNRYRIESVISKTTYYVRVKAVSRVGLQSSGIVEQITTQGNNSFFANVTGLTSRYEQNVLTLVWNPVNDLRPLVYEIRKGSSWNTAITLGTTPLTRFVTQGSGIYWVSAYYNNVYSVSPASIDVQGSISPQNIIKVYDEYTSGWSGTVDGGAVKFEGGIKLAGAGMFDDIPDFDNVTSFDFYGGIQASGTYTIPESHRVDIGVAENCNIAGSITVTKEASPEFTGILEHCADGKIYIRVAQDDGTFGEWNEFYPGPYLGRIFDFQVRLTSSDPGATVFLSRFTYSVDMPDKYDQGKEVWVETTGTVIPFNYNFHAQPQMLITVLNAEGGETVVLKSDEITNSQFTVRIINGSGVPVRKQINWVAKGY